MPRRILPFTAAALFFVSVASTVTTHGRAGAQAAPPAAPVALPAALATSPEPAKLSQTFVQLDGASLIAAFGALGATLAAGIRSAAVVVTKYMAAQEGKSEARELAQAKTVQTLAEVVARYHADRAASTDAVEEFAEDLEELKEQIAGDAGRVKPRKRVRRRPPPLPSLPSVSDDTDHTATPAV